MDVTSRILIYLPTGQAAASAGNVRAVAEGADRLGLTVLRREPYLLASQGVPAQQTGPEGVRLILDMFEGTAASGRRFQGNDGVPDWSGAHELAEREAQFYNLIEAADGFLRIESDPLGMKPLYRAELPDGVLFGSRILDMLDIFPALAQPLDRLALYEFMVFRAPLVDRTLHQRIRRSSCGDCYRWDPASGLSATRARRFAIPAVDATLFVDEALASIKAALTDSIGRRTAGSSRPVSLALSGGFDSRLIAAIAAETGLPIRALSYGRHYQPELLSAKAAAKALGIPLTCLPYPTDNSIERVPLHLETVEATADLSTSQIANLFRIPSERGSPIFHGFLGEVLSGHRLRHLPWQVYGTLDSTADALARSFEGPIPEIFKKLFGAAAPGDEVRADIRRDLAEGSEPYQAYTLWDIENRQRRYIGAQFPILGTRFDVIAPYYDRRLFECWLSVPPAGLDSRALLRRLFATQYPALAQIPHSEEVHPITPRLSRQLASFARDLPYKLVSRSVPTGLRERLGIPGVQNRYIWHLANLNGPRERAHMLRRIRELKPAAATALGLEIPGELSRPLQEKAELQPLRMLFLVSEYAAWLRERVPASGR